MITLILFESVARVHPNINIETHIPLAPTGTSSRTSTSSSIIYYISTSTANCHFVNINSVDVLF